MQQGDENWIRGYGIRCNNCFMYFIDDDDVPLIHVTDEGAGWEIHGCPTCKTDAYLMDAPGYEGGYWNEEPVIAQIIDAWSGFSDLFDEDD